MQLRTYQREAVDAVYRYLGSHDDNPCVVIPTGGGKTPVISTICRDAVERWSGRVMVLAHVRELVEQSAGTLAAMAPTLDVGVFSAGLGRRETDRPVTVAGIQSVYKRAHEFGPLDLILVDEAHMIPADGEGMYRRFLDDARIVNPRVRVVGLTATPYRLKSGEICGSGNILNRVCYEAGVRQLIDGGYLSPLRSRVSSGSADTSGLHVRGGEYVAGEAEALMDRDGLVEAACREIVKATQDRRGVLVFCAGVDHAAHVRDTLGRLSSDCGLVTGETPKAERDATLDRFRAGDLKYLSNVNVLTTGFDAPHVDCVALLRPTMSPGLYYQMVGRGFRMCEGKADCLVLDFAGNVERHGPVDRIEPGDRPGSGTGDKGPPFKLCPECNKILLATEPVCTACGYQYPEPENKLPHRPRPGDEPILSTGDVSGTEYVIGDVAYHVHTKRSDKSAPKTMRVEYYEDGDALAVEPVAKEWVCFSHEGYARRKAEAWWAQRSRLPVPDTTEEAVRLANAGALAMTNTIRVKRRHGEKFELIDRVRLDDPPPAGSVPEADERAARLADAYHGAADDNHSYDIDELPF